MWVRKEAQKLGEVPREGDVWEAEQGERTGSKTVKLVSLPAQFTPIPQHPSPSTAIRTFSCLLPDGHGECLASLPRYPGPLSLLGWTGTLQVVERRMYTGHIRWVRDRANPNGHSQVSLPGGSKGQTPGWREGSPLSWLSASGMSVSDHADANPCWGHVLGVEGFTRLLVGPCGKDLDFHYVKVDHPFFRMEICGLLAQLAVKCCKWGYSFGPWQLPM